MNLHFSYSQQRLPTDEEEHITETYMPVRLDTTSGIRGGGGVVHCVCYPHLLPQTVIDSANWVVPSFLLEFGFSLPPIKNIKSTK